MIMNNTNGKIQRFRDECLKKFEFIFLAEVMNKISFWEKVENLQQNFTAHELYFLSFNQVDQLETKNEKEKIELIANLVAIVDMQKIPHYTKSELKFIPNIFVKENCIGWENFSIQDKEKYERTVESLTKSLKVPEKVR